MGRVLAGTCGNGNLDYCVLVFGTGVVNQQVGAVSIFLLFAVCAVVVWAHENGGPEL